MTGPLGGGGQQDVVVRLRLEADKGNAGVASALSVEIDKLRKKAEASIKFGGVTGLSTAIQNEFKNASTSVGNSTRALIDKWSKEIQPLSIAVAQAYRDEAAAADQAANAKIAADNRFAKNRSTVLRTLGQADKQQEIAAPGDKSQTRSPDQLLRRAATDQKGRIKETAHGLAETADEVTKFAKAIATLSDAKPESIEKLAKSLEKFKAVFDMFKSGVDVLNGVNSALKTMQNFAATSVIEQRLRGAATSGGQAASAVEGAGAAVAGKVAGGAAVAGEGGGLLAGLGGGATLATGAVVAAAAIALHDGFKTLLNWTGILGGHFDTLTGTLSEWNESVKNSTRLEEQMNIEIEARGAREEERNKIGERTRAYYAGRERIQDAKTGIENVEEAKIRHEYAADRMADASQGTVGRPMTKNQLATAKQNDIASNEEEERAVYKMRMRSIEKRSAETAALLDLTRLKNAHPPLDILMPHGGSGNDTPASRKATQDAIDKQQEEHPIESNTFSWRKFFRWGPDESDGKTLIPVDHLPAEPGVYNTLTAPPRGVAQPGGDNRLGPQADLTPGKPELHTQLAQEETFLAAQKEGNELAQKRTEQLRQQENLLQQQVLAGQEQLRAAHEQVKAAQEAKVATKAHLSMMTAAQQHTAAGILHKLNSGQQLSRPDALFLQEHGIMQGSIGKAVNAQLASGLDPEFAKEMDNVKGGWDDLEKAQQNEKDIIDNLVNTMEDEQDAHDELTDAIKIAAQWANSVFSGTKAVESTKSEMDGYRDPNREPERITIKHGVQGAANDAVRDINAAGEEFVAAIGEVGIAAAGQIQALRDATHEMAQRIKRMHA